MDNFIDLFRSMAVQSWDMNAIADYTKTPYTYGAFAKELVVLHELWQDAGLEKGDKIAINARSSTNWVTAFMAAVTGRYVSVQLFNGFTPADTQSLVNHSGSRILYTEKAIFNAMDFEKSPQLIAAIDTNTLELLASRGDFAELFAQRYDTFDKRHPSFGPADFNFEVAGLEDICAIMYTSGSTGNPKGVMLKVLNFSANIALLKKTIPFKRGENYVSVLPYAHIFGLTVDAIAPLCFGTWLNVLCLPPLPVNVHKAFQELRPRIFFAVPLILTKYISYIFSDVLKSAENKSKLDNYKENPEFCEELRKMLVDSMGGQMEVFATGGAAIPSDLEEMLALKLKAPFITGYGMTETAPVISLGPVGNYKLKSCGMVYEGYIDVKIDSPDPLHIPGEVLVKGDIVYAGYYKNPEATAATFTEDGWFRTGDIGTMDEDRILFLSGRSKNMILSSNGQNIFPEEIEVVLNTLPYVAESMVVSRNDLLYAIIVPNGDAVANANLDQNSLNEVMRGNLKKLNTLIPAYSAVNLFELRFEPFAKTPKGSIKRFMYK